MDSIQNPQLEQIVAMLRQGDKDGAVRVARSHVEEALATGEADRATLAWANLAQTCAAVEDLPEAAKALEKAVADGYSDPFLVKAEPDLAPLRSETRFDAVVARLEAGIDRDD